MHRTINVGRIDTGYKHKAKVTVEANYDGRRLTITGTAQRPRAADIDAGGQILDLVAEIPSDDLTISRDTREQLLNVWRAWHLNDMRAGCEHQREMGWTYDEYPSEPCPVCGYKYGTAWLFEPVPDDVIEWLFPKESVNA